MRQATKSFFHVVAHFLLSLHNPVARAARALAGRYTASEARRAKGYTGLANPFQKILDLKICLKKFVPGARGCAWRLHVAGAGAPEGCRFAAAGPNKVRQQGAGAARAA